MAGLLDDVHDVPVHVVRVDPVDPNRDRLSPPAPVVLEQCLDHVLPGLLLVAGGYRVLEVEKDVVRLALESLRRTCAGLDPGTASSLRCSRWRAGS